MDAKGENVRALVRGLEILRFLNAAGAAKPAEIAKATDIPRPSVYRLLKTLEEAGYVLFSASDARVRVSPLASGLGDNAQARSKLCRAAAPHMVGFTDAQAWPLDLSVYHDLRMLVEETTHWRSPLSIDTNVAGSALPLLRSSAGRAYLAHIEPQEREIILNLLRTETDPDDAPFLSPHWLGHRLGEYQAQGFATRGPDIFRKKTSSLAVPVMMDGRVAGCLSVIWIASALSLAEASKRYVEPLRELAAQISQEAEAPSQ